MPVEECIAGRWSLFATHPKYFGVIAELYVTADAADVRATALRLVGYTVEVTFLKARAI